MPTLCRRCIVVVDGCGFGAWRHQIELCCWLEPCHGYVLLRISSLAVQLYVCSVLPIDLPVVGLVVVILIYRSFLGEVRFRICGNASLVLGDRLLWGVYWECGSVGVWECGSVGQGDLGSGMG